MVAAATAEQYMRMAWKLISLLCTLSVLLYGQSVQMELENNPQSLALLTFTRGQIRIHPFDGPNVSFCVFDPSLTPHVSRMAGRFSGEQTSHFAYKLRASPSCKSKPPIPIYGGW